MFFCSSEGGRLKSKLAFITLVKLQVYMREPAEQHSLPYLFAAVNLKRKPTYLFAGYICVCM